MSLSYLMIDIFFRYGVEEMEMQSGGGYIVYIVPSKETECVSVIKCVYSCQLKIVQCSKICVITLMLRHQSK